MWLKFALPVQYKIWQSTNLNFLFFNLLGKEKYSLICMKLLKLRYVVVFLFVTNCTISAGFYTGHHNIVRFTILADNGYAEAVFLLFCMNSIVTLGQNKSVQRFIAHLPNYIHRCAILSNIWTFLMNFLQHFTGRGEHLKMAS